MSEWTNLTRREAGLPPETDFTEGVPSHLFLPLHEWVGQVMRGGISAYWHRVELQTRVSFYRSGEKMLAAVDALLYWYPRMPPAARQYFGQTFAGPGDWQQQVANLDEILTLGRSVWRVNARGDGLERRLEDAITAATRQTIIAAPSVTQDHLYAAWAAIYSLNPNPDLAYDEAVRAVEDTACPLILPSADNTRTLGKAIGALRNDLQAHSPMWEVILPDKTGNASDVERLTSMMSLLWEGQASRHAGSSKSRRSTTDEAAAAVHLAVLLVRWLSTGVLRRKPRP